MLTQLDLCSGIGAGYPFAGLRLGGFELVGLAEIDPYCRAILSHRYPRTRIIGDIKRHDWRGEKFSRIADVDLITASPNCQPFSIQGKRLGADDERDCFPAVLGAIAAIRPRYFCIENVRGLLSCPFRPGGGKGSYFGNLMWLIHKCGYDAEWQVISSGHFGAPFRRERLLLVGVSERLKLQWEGTTPWTHQVREAIEKVRSAPEGRSRQPGVSRSRLQSPHWVDESTNHHYRWGVPSGDGVIRDRRAALGNALDPRVAQIALERVLYLNSLLEK